MERERLSTAVEKQLECPVCLLQLTAPKLLQCMHTFCQGCLVHISKENRIGGISIRCPTCRQKTKVIALGKLHTNFIVEGIIDAMELAQRAAKNKENKSCESSGYSDTPEITDVNYTSFSSSETSNEVNTREIENSESVVTDFNFVPSFYWGDLNNTSFAEPVTMNNLTITTNSTVPTNSISSNSSITTNSISTSNSTTTNSSYDFSTFNSAPSFSFGSLDKASFSTPLTKMENQLPGNGSNLFTGCNINIDRVTNTSIPLFNANDPTYQWGSLDKTSFA